MCQPPEGPPVTLYKSLIPACFDDISSGRQEPPNANPIVRFYKTRFALGEEIFFWEGAEQMSQPFRHSENADFEKPNSPQRVVLRFSR